jgi:division/cell wall cluster transcriptional repressor MraZ
LPGCHPQPEWEEIERKIMKLSSFNKQTRKLKRLLVGHATECELDGNGRILLAPPLREFAGLNKDVMLIGQGNKFEIWDDGAWNARRAEWLESEGEDDGKLPPDLESFSARECGMNITTFRYCWRRRCRHCVKEDGVCGCHVREAACAGN